MRKRPSAEICASCRHRKVKCDGRPSGCENCERLKFRCSFSAAANDAEPDNGDAYDIDRIPRKRVRLACRPCKKQKVRCSAETPACRRCMEKDIQCVYLPSKRFSKALARPSEAPIDSPSTVIPQSSLSARIFRTTPTEHTASSREVQDGELHAATGLRASSSMIKLCIDAFFNVLYPNPEFSFIHRAVFMQTWQAGNINSVLLKAVCGVAARFVPGLEIETADSWVDEAQVELMKTFEKPSIVRLQALQLTVLHYKARRQFRKVLLPFSLATRMAFLLRLNYEDTSLSFLAQESRRRLMWSIYVTDTVLAGGIPDFTVCPATRIHLRLPCEELNFQLDRAVEGELLHPEPGQRYEGITSLLAYYIRVMDIRDRVLRYTKEVAAVGTDPSSLTARFGSFEAELHHLQNSFPQDLVFSTKNLSLREFSKVSLFRFVQLHIWWHQCHCDLYRFLIPGFRESVSGRVLRQVPDNLIEYCQMQCVTHARSISEIFHIVLNLDQAGTMADLGLAVPAYQCANILCRSVHMAGEFQEIDVKAGVAACLEFTKKQARFSEVAAAILEDVQRLYDHGVPTTSASRQRTPEEVEEECSPASTLNKNAPRHRFSRHNPVVAAGIEDDGAELGLRDVPPMLSPTSCGTPRLQSRSTPINSHASYQPQKPSGQRPLDLVLGSQQNAMEPHSSFSQAAYAPASDSQMNTFDTTRDTLQWMWDSDPSIIEGDFDFQFDPVWIVQNQWDVGL